MTYYKLVLGNCERAVRRDIETRLDTVLQNSKVCVFVETGKVQGLCDGLYLDNDPGAVVDASVGAYVQAVLRAML